MIKRMMVVLGLVMGLFVASEILLPLVMSSVVNQGLMNLTGSERVSANLASKPAALMLLGKFNTVQIKAENAKIDKLVFYEMNVALTNAQLDITKFLKNRAVNFQSVDKVDITAVVAQDELARYLNQTVKGLKNTVVVITPEKVTASSNLAIGGIVNVAVSLEGRIVSEGQNVKFVTDKFLINNTATGNIGGTLLTEIPIIDASKLPFNVKVRDTVMGNGKVTVYLDNH